MIEFFYNNESLINLICMSWLLIGILTFESTKRIFTASVQAISSYLIFFSISFLMINVMLNGLHKGF